MPYASAGVLYGFQVSRSVWVDGGNGAGGWNEPSNVWLQDL